MGGELVRTEGAIWATSSLVEKFNLVAKEYTRSPRSKWLEWIVMDEMRNFVEAKLKIMGLFVLRNHLSDLYKNGLLVLE